MKHNFNSMQATLEFKRAYKSNLKSPASCKSLSDTRRCIDYLYLLMKALNKHYGYVPQEAKELLVKYNEKQERLVFEDYVKDYMR